MEIVIALELQNQCTTSPAQRVTGKVALLAPKYYRTNILSHDLLYSDRYVRSKLCRKCDLKTRLGRFAQREIAMLEISLKGPTSSDCFDNFRTYNTKMLTLHYNDFLLTLFNETNCTPASPVTSIESFSSGTVDSLNPQCFNISNSLLLRLDNVVATDDAADSCDCGGYCLAATFGCFEIYTPIPWGLHRSVDERLSVDARDERDALINRTVCPRNEMQK